jgi:hypothetical protein
MSGSSELSNISVLDQYVYCTTLTVVEFFIAMQESETNAVVVTRSALVRWRSSYAFLTWDKDTTRPRRGSLRLSSLMLLILSVD